jgi:mono/diheme cytochrome c family protein
MRTRILWTVALLAISGASAALSVIGAPKDRDIPANVLAVFKKNCVRCHTGPKPPKGLSLVPGKIAAVIDAPSAEVPDLRIVDPNAPEASYLLKKVRRETGIAGKPMPPGKALSADELQVLEAWIAGLK